jgi:hypothetical protein
MVESSTDRQGNRFGGTLRRDAWWVELLPVVLVLSAFGIYATFRAFEGKFYAWGPYLSPFYSPLIDPKHRWWRFSPVLLILAGPLGFRATCYHYRKAYYRAFFLRPPACAVSEGHRGAYRGETCFSFIPLPCLGVPRLPLVGRNSRFLSRMGLDACALLAVGGRQPLRHSP